MLFAFKIALIIYIKLNTVDIVKLSEYKLYLDILHPIKKLQVKNLPTKKSYILEICILY